MKHTKWIPLNLGLALGVGLLISSPAAAVDGWIENFEAAKKQAAKENKDILIDFTGSDWCGWCIKLKNEVFTKAEFKKDAPRHFVLLELDYPREKKQSSEIKAQNAKLQALFGVRGFPTIMLVDSKGRPYARTGYQQGGPDNYLKHLGELRHQKHSANKALTEAANSTGTAKAKALDTALAGIRAKLDGREPGSAEGLVVNTYTEVVDEIIELDTKNEAGLKEKYVGIRETAVVKAALQDIMKSAGQTAKPKDLIKVAGRVAQFIKNKKPKGEALQQALFNQSLLNYRGGKKDEAKKLLQEAQKVVPDSAMGKRIDQILKQAFGAGG